MICVKFANVMNNATIINTFNSDNSNITKTQQSHIMATITNGIWRFKLMIKIPMLTNYRFLQLVRSVHSPKSILL